MRIRTIKPEFWEHPVMGRQSDATKLLAIGLLNVADDEGYFYADPKAVRNLIRPQDDDSRITTVSLRDLSEIGYITIRKHPTHGDVGKVESFTSHQVINKPKPSKIKDLYEYGVDTVLIPDEYRLERKGREGIPPNPQGGIDELPLSPKETPVLPDGWKKLNSTEQRRKKVNYNTPLMVRVGRFLSQRETTLWTIAEYLALQDVNPTEDELEIIGQHYSLVLENNGFRYKDILTLLNNWPKARTRAEAYFQEFPEHRNI